MSKVIVGLSGGVDSAVAALLLKNQGYEVIGVTMINYALDSSEIEDAREIAGTLGIKHVEIDMREEFKKSVIGYFVEEYLKGRTPNPCVMCNLLVKFESLIRVMEQEKADHIATGHYAEIVKLNNGRYTIAVNKSGKDQTYALCRLSQYQLQHLLTPLAKYDKDEVRKIALEAGIPVANKKDSQDICFVQKGKYFEFIKEYLATEGNEAGNKDRITNVDISDKKGNFVDEEGNVLGTHNGISHYTIGQRKKLGLALNKPVFVKELRPLSNEVVISTGGDVYFDELICDDTVYMAAEEFEEGERLLAKIRYAHEGTYCRVELNNTCKVIFEKPVRAVTPGQAIVFYKDERVYASGIIC